MELKIIIAVQFIVLAACFWKINKLRTKLYKIYNPKPWYTLEIKHRLPVTNIKYKLDKYDAEDIINSNKSDLKFYDYNRNKHFIIKDSKILAYSIWEEE